MMRPLCAIVPALNRLRLLPNAKQHIEQGQRGNKIFNKLIRLFVKALADPVQLLGRRHFPTIIAPTDLC